MTLRDEMYDPDYPVLDVGDVVYISIVGHGLVESNAGLYCVIREYSATGYYGSPGYLVSKYEHDLVNHDYEKDWVGVATFGEAPLVLLNINEEHTVVVEGSKQQIDEVLEIKRDMGQHYRYSFRLNLTPQDIENGFVMVNLDPYRISTVYNLGGWREHLVKKGIRGTEKGHTEKELLDELQCILDRAKQMYEESCE